MDIEIKGYRFQIMTAAGQPDGLAYRFPGRCLRQVRWMNLTQGSGSYTLRPVRWREPT
jgi:hypothetical protein